MGTPEDRPQNPSHRAGQTPSRRSVLVGMAGASLASLSLTACSGEDRGSATTGPRDRAGDAAAGRVEALDAPSLDGVEADPFTLGVSSGDPDATSVVLWTRLAPDPSRADGGMPAADAEVVWELATGDDFTELVATGTAPASTADGHSVHVLADGLPSDGTFHYRFRAGEWTSPSGRARTAPEPGAGTEKLVVTTGSCQDYEAGFYAAHREMAAEGDVDLVLWLGDFIYEGGPSETGVRTHSSAEVRTLDEYRVRYAQYLSDRDLQSARAAAPWLVIWDDHEVENNYAGLAPEDDADAATFAERRAAAYQAWWEFQPTRLDRPSGPDLPAYREVVWGDLARVFALDTRQERADQVCAIFPGVDAGPICADLDNPDQVIISQDQERWLTDGLAEGDVRWNLVANQVVMSPVPIIGENLDDQAVAAAAASVGVASLPSLDGLRGVMADQWDGYPAQRKRVLEAMAGAEAPTIVLTGDIHASGAGPLRADPADPASEVVGAELVGTSISSDNGQFGPLLDSIFGPAFEYYQGTKRGYLRCEITPEKATATYVVLDDARRPDATASVDARFSIGRDGDFTRLPS